MDRQSWWTESQTNRKTVVVDRIRDGHKRQTVVVDRNTAGHKRQKVVVDRNTAGHKRQSWWRKQQMDRN